MPTTRTCPKCGVELADNALDSVCPKCVATGVLGLAVETQVVTEFASCELQSAIPNPTSRYFGDYELLEEIARGGMGVVYKARQVSLNRVVAVKMILAGQLARPEDVQRFRTEAEAAANLQHPNIVAIHEVGEHEGQHYFSMDFIEGRSLAALLRDGPLPVQRAARYVQIIAEALHYAHQRGTLHRDLKPSNVLIDAHDQPQVTDFGLAKRLKGDSELTLTGQVLGTPNYMPPEQAAGQHRDVGPQSDVYGLGAILYYLTTGRPPFLAETVPATLEQVIHTDPLPPHSLNPNVARDLETVCLKCLEKEPPRRYETALALAQDLGRYLNHEPILALPPSAVYRTLKFVRRHRIGVVVAGAFLLLLTAASVVSTTYGVRAHRERVQALKAGAEAKTNAETATAVLRFFQDKVLAAARPEGQAGGLGHDVTLRAAVESAQPAIATAFSNQPLVEASIRHVLGETYQYLTQYTNAIRQHERALALRRLHLGVENPDTLTSMDSLASAYEDAGRRSESMPMFEETLKLRKAKLGPDHPDTLQSMNNLALAYYHAARLREMLPLVEETFKRRRAKLGPDHFDTIDSMNNLAIAYRTLGRPREAILQFEQTVKLRKAKLGPDHPDTLVSIVDLALAYQAAGRLNEAIPLFEETWKVRKTKLGPDHAYTLLSMHALASAYEADNRLSESLPLFQENARLWKAKFGIDKPETLVAMDFLAAAYLKAFRVADAIALLEETLKTRRVKLGPEHPNTLSSIKSVASAYFSATRFAEAENLFRELLNAERKIHSDDSRTMAGTIAWLGESLLRQGKHAEAELLLRESLSTLEKKQPGLSSTFRAQGLLGWALLEQRKYAEAEPMLLQAYEGLQSREAANPSSERTRFVKETAARLLELYETQGKLDQANEWRQKLR